MTCRGGELWMTFSYFPRPIKSYFMNQTDAEQFRVDYSAIKYWPFLTIQQLFGICATLQILKRRDKSLSHELNENFILNLLQNQIYVSSRNKKFPFLWWDWQSRTFSNYIAVSSNIHLASNHPLLRKTMRLLTLNFWS